MSSPKIATAGSPTTALPIKRKFSDSNLSHGVIIIEGLLAATVSTSESTFCTSNYYPSIVAALVFGLLNVLFSLAIKANSTLQFFIGCTTFALGLVCYQWFDLHGMKMTRREQVYFDEKNLLQTTERLDFNLPPVVEDLTPGGIPESRLSILQQLFRDEKDEQMQKWYKQHYGPVYDNAMRAAKQERMMEETAKKQENKESDEQQKAD